MVIKRTSDATTLLDIYQMVGELRSDVKQLLAARLESDVELRSIGQRMVELGTDNALIKQELSRVTPIVDRLDQKSISGDGAFRFGKYLAHGTSVMVGGIINALVTIWAHRG